MGPCSVYCSQLLTLVVATAFMYPAVAEGLTCPGLVLSATSADCTSTCQLSICEALAAFFQSTNKAANTEHSSWRRKQGWTLLKNTPCSQIITANSTEETPPYCSWHGVKCCSTDLQQLGHCMVSDSVWSLQLTVNGLTGSVESLEFQRAVQELHSCGLMRLDLAGNTLSGSLTSFWGQLPNLMTLNLDENDITGTLPDALRNLTMLMEFTMNKNPMHGSLPEWLSELQSLQLLSLSALTGYNPNKRRGLIGTIPASLSSLRNLIMLGLRSNSLTGTLPISVCQQGMAWLDLQGNELDGDVGQLLLCPSLAYLDISSNRFTGVLPDIPYWNWPVMQVLILSSNDIEGSLPSALLRLPELHILKIANNRLNGTIGSEMRRSMRLMHLDLSNNKLSGTIDEGFWHTLTLGTVDLSHNQLSGTLSPAVGVGSFLRSVHLDGNLLSGQIPPEFGFASALSRVSLANNPVTCSSGYDAQINSPQCGPEDMLPCFLQLSTLTIPRLDASYMECPVITRKSRSQAMQDCQGLAAAQLGDAAADLPEMEVETQTWNIDPSYYLYQGCKCLGGFTEVWSDAHTVLTCEPAANTMPAWVIPTAATVTTIGIIFLAIVALLAWYRIAVQLRRRWQREKEVLLCRQKGVPNGGQASIVVTDVEGYSELMRTNAGPATQAMGIHNAILRKAVATHGGHVIEQEGDSWSVAFHKPVDAAAFCLQVQQALQKSQWPSELKMKPGISAPGLPDSRGIRLSEVSPYTTLIGSSASQTNSQHGPVAAYSARRFSSVAGAEQTGGGAQASEHGALATMLQRLTGGGGRRNSDVADGPLAGGSGVRTGSVDSGRGPSWLNLSAMGQMAGFTIASRVASVVSTAVPGRVNNPPATMSNSTTAEDAIHGLRVRMGIATGWIPAGTDITRSALFGSAKAVSDMAHGGQILMDSSTAAELSVSLAELGCVDHKGYNDELLASAYQAGVGQQIRGLINVLTSVLRVRRRNREPSLLHQGQFWVPCLSMCCAVQKPSALKVAGQTPTHNACLGSVIAAAVGLAEGCDDAGDSHGQPLESGLCSHAAVVAAAVTAVYGVEAADAYIKLSTSLFGIVAQPLHARSKLWTHHLNLVEGTQQMVKGYFTAPGSITANLTADTRCIELPAITLVSAQLNEGRVFMRHDKVAAEYVHRVLVQIIQALLLQVPDGYLCTADDSDLKYMAAFSEPAIAAEWALLLQETLQHVPWPARVLAALPSTRRSWGSLSGGRVTDNPGGQRWTGLKIGIAQGVPDSVLPNHRGHAQYHGSVVDLAESIMGSAAKPGQILLTQQLAQAVLCEWQQRRVGVAAQQDAASDKPVLWPDLAASEPAHNSPAHHQGSIHPDITHHAAVDTPAETSVLVREEEASHDGQLLTGPSHNKQSSQTLAMGAPEAYNRMPESAVLAKGANEDSVKQVVHVTVHEAGHCTLRGLGPVPLVSLMCTTHSGLYGACCATVRQTTPPEGGQGPTALATVAEIQSCTVHLPKFLPQFEKILEALAEVEPQHTAAVVLGDPCDTRRQKRSRDSKTRTVTATMDF